MQLDVTIATLESARGVALDVFRVAGILQQRSIALDARTLGAAKERRHRNTFKLPPNIPQRNVESRQRVSQRTGAAERKQHAFYPWDKLFIRGALSNGETPDPVVERRDNHWTGCAEGLPPTHHAATGRHAYIKAFNMCARYALRHRRRSPDVQRNAERNSLDRCDCLVHISLI